MELLKSLSCPITKNGLDLIQKIEFIGYNIPDSFGDYGELTHGLIDKSKNYFYPIFDDIII